MSKDRYEYEGGDTIHDFALGTRISIQDAVDVMNAQERVFIRIIEVIEQREEAT